MHARSEDSSYTYQIPVFNATTSLIIGHHLNGLYYYTPDLSLLDYPVSYYLTF